MAEFAIICKVLILGFTFISFLMNVYTNINGVEPKGPSGYPGFMYSLGAFLAACLIYYGAGIFNF